jgi:hypothetical protein
LGGAIYLGSARAYITNSSFYSNSIVGTDGARGGDAGAGEMTRGIGGKGGDGGQGANAAGADLRLEYSDVFSLNNTFNRSRAGYGIGGQGGAGGESWYPPYPDGQPGATGALGSVIGELISAVEEPVTFLNKCHLQRIVLRQNHRRGLQSLFRLHLPFYKPRQLK